MDNSYAKIDMSLDDIIKLNKKDKQAAAKKGQAKSKQLTVAQKQRARAKTAQSNKPQTSRTRQNPPAKISKAGNRGSIKKKSKLGITKTGNINAGKKIQGNKQTQSQIKLPGNPRQQVKSRRGGTSSQTTLGVRIQNTQNNQRKKRQQITNQKRPGLKSVRGNGRKRIQDNAITRGNIQTAQNRRYNQQPRRQYSQQPRGRGQGRQQRGNRGRRGAGPGSSSGRTVTLY